VDGVVMTGAEAVLRGPLAFVHIPKTAGTTFRTQLRRQYGWDRVLELQPNNPESNFETLARMSEAERARYRAFVGHWGLEWQDHFPADTQYLTFLRQPVDRVKSLYQHVWRDTSHDDHRLLRERNLSLGDYLRSGITLETDNSQVRFVAGAPLDEPCSEDMLRCAMANLDRFVVVGFTERFDESLALIRRRLGWRWPVYVSENTRPPNADSGIVTPACLAAVAEKNQYAQRLYDFALQRFDEQMRDPQFRRDVARLRLLNRLYRVYHRLRYLRVSAAGTIVYASHTGVGRAIQDAIA
jgi:hypothetical protein